MRMRLLLLSGLAFASMDARAQSEAAEMDGIYAACRASGGTAASNYSEWVAQNGCICNGVASGARTCTGSPESSQAGSTTDLATLEAKAVAQGLMNGDPGLAGVGILGMILGMEMQGDPEADAERARQAAAAAEQQRRNQALQAEFQRQRELSRQRILGALKDVSAPNGLALKMGAAATLSVVDATSGLNTRAIVPIGIARIPAHHELQVKLGDEAERSSEQARAGFDTAGPMPGALLPPAPPDPPGMPLPTREQRIQGFRSALARNASEANALATRLELLQTAAVPDPVAIQQAQDDIRSKESEKKKILVDLSAEDPDEPSTTPTSTGESQ
jgi:hypothetical protein